MILVQQTGVHMARDVGGGMTIFKLFKGGLTPVECIGWYRNEAHQLISDVNRGNVDPATWPVLALAKATPTLATIAT